MTLASDPSHPAQALPDTTLRRSLRRARREWWRVAIVRASLLAFAAASLTVAAAWLSAWFADRPGRLSAEPGDVVAMTFLITFALGVALGLLVAGIRAPSLLALSRRADRVLDQAQRLSTAYEVQSRGAPSSLIERALLTEVEELATTLAWPSVGRSSWRRPIPIAIAFAIALAAAALVVPVPNAPNRRAGAELPATAARPDRRAQDAITAQRVAELLQRVAETEESPYLQAVATSFADLADRLASGSIDAAEADRVLQELVGHLEVAARDVGGAFGAALEAALAGQQGVPASEAVPGPASAPAAGDPARADAGADTPGGDPSRSADAASPTNADASMYMALDTLVREYEGEVLGPTQRAIRADPTSEDAFYGGVLNADTDPNAPPQEAAGMRADAPGAGDVAGAAQQSSERAGDAAGDGQADLAGASDAFLGAEADATRSAALPRNENESGRFVEVELVPDTVLGSARAFERDVAAGPFRRADEAAFVTRTIDATYRDVVSRYFLPGTISSDGSPGGAVP